MKIKLTNSNDSVVIEKSNGTSSEVATKADISAITKSDIGLGNVGNFKAVSTEANQELTDTEKANARINIGASALIGDDAARANWGGDWRMPTKAEFQALGNAVNTAWTADYQSSGIAGLVCTDKTDSSKTLFFPAAGDCYDGSVEGVGNGGGYWSSSLYTTNRQSAYSLGFSSYGANWGNNGLRYYGYSVRPVLDGTNANGHDYVEIDGIKWATMNIGASRSSDYGLYFQWGDTQGYTTSQVGNGTGQKFFGWADYKYGNGTSSPGAAGMTKYNATDGLVTLEYLRKVAVTGDYNDLSNKPVIPEGPNDDAARAYWGGDWRMPTESEFQDLIAAATNDGEIDYLGSGVNGRLFSSHFDSSKLFFPATGYCGNGTVSSVGSFCNYWSSSLSTSEVTSGRNLNFIGRSAGIFNSDRYSGLPVRPILDGTNANGHEYVEIDGLKWATMNIGASSETDYGLYFQWGDTQGYTASQVGSGAGQKPFSWTDYKYGNGTSSPDAAGMTKYNATDGLTTLELTEPVVSLQKVATTGNYNDLNNKPASLPASDVYSWAKASSKPSYSFSELSGTSDVVVKDSDGAIDVTSGSFNSIYIGDFEINRGSNGFLRDDGNTIWNDWLQAVEVRTISSNIQCTPGTVTDVIGASYTYIYRNTGSTNVTVTVPTTYSSRTIYTPDGSQLNITIPPGGYGEISFVFGGSDSIYVRGI